MTLSPQAKSWVSQSDDCQLYMKIWPSDDPGVAGWLKRGQPALQPAGNTGIVARPDLHVQLAVVGLGHPGFRLGRQRHSRPHSVPVGNEYTAPALHLQASNTAAHE